MKFKLAARCFVSIVFCSLMRSHVNDLFLHDDSVCRSRNKREKVSSTSEVDLIFDISFSKISIGRQMLKEMDVCIILNRKYDV